MCVCVCVWFCICKFDIFFFFDSDKSSEISGSGKFDFTRIGVSKATTSMTTTTKVTMDGKLIEELILRRDKFNLIAPLYAGLWSSDNLPNDLVPGKIYLLNELKSTDKVGSHWTVLRRREKVDDGDESYGSDYLCSYGSSPNHLAHVHSVMRKYGQIFSYRRRLQVHWVSIHLKGVYRRV